MLDYLSIEELARQAAERGQTIGQVVLADQAVQLEQTEAEILAGMRERLHVMRQSAESGLQCRELSASGLSGASAAKMRQAVENGQTLAGPVLGKILARSLAVAEVNARMGRIVAAPTAGSCGIMPAVILTLAEARDIPEDRVVLGLLAAAGIGLVIAGKAFLAGAAGGCQAECGSAAAMAAAAAAEFLGGTPRQVVQACALALKNSLGLACDPVAGLVEVPCVKRNASMAAVALAAVEMALAGIESVIPADEIVAAMKQIGDSLPAGLKETSTAGLAATPTGRAIAENLASQETTA